MGYISSLLLTYFTVMCGYGILAIFNEFKKKISEYLRILKKQVPNFPSAPTTRDNRKIVANGNSISVISSSDLQQVQSRCGDNYQSHVFDCCYHLRCLGLFIVLYT